MTKPRDDRYEVPMEERGNYLSVSQVAAELDRSLATIKQWNRYDKWRGPRYWAYMDEKGVLWEWLYTESDLRALRRLRDRGAGTQLRRSS